MAKCPATKLSLEYLRGQGFLPWVVERMIPSKPFPKKVDLWNMFDIACLDPWTGRIQFVQTTSATNRSHRRTKLEENVLVLSALIRPGIASVLHSWKKVNGKWDVVVEIAAVEKDGVTVALQQVTIGVPSMAEVRALIRQEKKMADRTEREFVGRSARQASHENHGT